MNIVGMESFGAGVDVNDVTNPPLDYQRRESRARKRFSPVMPWVLCAPGIFCFTLYIFGRPIDSILRAAGVSPRWFDVKDAFWISWIIAVLTAIVSVVHYPFMQRVPRRYPFAVRENLFVNSVGLLFSLPVLIEMLCEAIGP